MTPWRCYAHPPALSGKECGHLNTTGQLSAFGESRLVCCEHCGCTKIASDDRQRRKEAKR
jgi:hypothetical protein